MLGATKNLILGRKQLYCLALDGATQYASKANPVGLDLNGPEMITADDDRTADATKGNWADNGNHSAARDTTYKKTGAASLKITATAAGDAVTNFESLPAARFSAIVAGNKYTKEFWAYGDTNGVTLAIAIGDQVVTGKVVYNATAGIFVKVVFNFLATANTVVQPIKVYVSGAGNVWIDDRSLTQKSDMLIQYSFTNKGTQTSKTVFQLSNAGLAPYILQTFGSITFFGGSQSDGTVTRGATATTSAYNDNIIHLCSIVFNAMGTCDYYVDGVLLTNAASMSLLGKMTFSSIHFGSTGSSGFYSGRLGGFQVSIFSPSVPSNIASIIAGINATYRRNGLPRTYTGGTMGLNVDLRSGGKDKSGMGNDLTLVGSPRIVRM
jgi:hypothetical protein